MNHANRIECQGNKKTILISGVSSGIGAETVLHLIKQGYQVLGLSRRQPKHPSIIWRQCDVRDSKSVNESVRQLVYESKTLDVVVCNAGLGHFGSIEEVSEETARIIFDTNYFGALNMINATLGIFRSLCKGQFIIISSLAGLAPLPFQAHYSASKAAVESLAFSLYIETASFGISVSIIELGYIQTSFNDSMIWETPEKSPYANSIKKCGDMIYKNMSLAPKANLIGNLIKKIIVSRRPKLRYPVGPSSKLVSLAKRIFTDSINVKLIRRHYDL